MGEEVDSGRGWDEAIKIASLIGEIPSLFSTCIRGLMADSREGEALSRGARHSLKVLMLGSSLKSSLLFAGKTFKPDLTKDDSFASPEAAAKIFKLGEIANIIALLFLYRRVQKTFGETHEDRWLEISKTLGIEAEIGGHLGFAIPKIGFSWGLMIGSMRHFGTFLLVASQPKAFQKYRVDMKMAKKEYDLAYELDVWGCTHLQVASIVLQTLGMGVNLAQALPIGTEAKLDNTLPTDIYRVRITTEWIKTLRKTGMQPEMTHRGDFYPLKKDLDGLLTLITEINSKGSRYNWLNKGKDDMPKASSKAAAATTPAPADEADEVSDEELEELEEIE